MIVTREHIEANARPCCRGLGLAVSDFQLPQLPEIPAALKAFEWKTVLIVALAAFLLYRLFFSRSASERRGKLRAARQRYTAELARIRSQYPRV